MRTGRPRPLRLRLLAALLGLSALGLAVFAVSGVLVLERSLLKRVDTQLRDFARTIGLRPPPAAPARPPGNLELPSQFQVAFYSPTGSLARRLPTGSPDGPDLTAEAVSTVSRRPFTVAGRTGEREWRVLLESLPSGERVAVSMSLESNQATVRQLLVIEVAVGAVVLTLLGALAWAVVRLGLRPLTRMERTAEAIAAGDIDRRVADADPRTETGRLGQALNMMLERLAAALRAREQSERRLRHFVADASHELRTPLTSIRGFAELYHHGQEARDPLAERLLRRIENEAGRMGVLVEDMLLLARLDEEPMLERSTVDLRVLAGDVVHAARARDSGRPITLEVPAEAVLVLGDEHRLHQVMANLVGNAITHTDRGTPVHVRVAHRPATGEAVPDGQSPGGQVAGGAVAAVVEVRDEGEGIDAGHLPYIFDRFYRADPSRSRAHGGTGLGLAIAAALVEAHRGRIEVASAPGRGTTFQVLLPCERSPGD
ncbi:two-component system, OmpR family, sensor kinase [Sinosporangium album]|uniref:histidine kinase n=1 Tax=Sinosporangium album TaxID=504805 RepID=A0A1G8DDA4_9ACTN|nr:HAMP domain-containing sensor histidine kinase [Sinosporangium album]SDH55702.1 two-component system, OmpR family, sensor kinase [Sinosporangium album]